MAFKKEVVEIIEPRDVFVGNPKAEVTLEEFGDLGNAQYPFCQQEEPGYYQP